MPDLKRVLLIDPDIKIAMKIKRYFARHGIRLEHALDGDSGSLVALRSVFDLIMMDVQLPKLNGLDLIKRLRRDGIDIPIVIFTSLNDLESKIAGLRLGADDYVIKPSSLPELLARVKIKMQRVPMPTEQMIVWEDLVVDLRNWQVRVDDKPLRIRKKELLILKTLARHPGQVVNRSTLVRATSGARGSGVYTSTIDVHISRLRKLLAEVGIKGLIETVHGAGYRLAVNRN